MKTDGAALAQSGAPPRNARRHGLAASEVQTQADNERVVRFALGFLGDLPRKGLAWDLACSAAAAQCQLERIALVEQELFADDGAAFQANQGQAVWQRFEQDLSLLEALVALEQGGERKPDLLSAAKADVQHDEITHMAHRHVALRHKLRNLERYRRRAISRRSRALENLAALAAGAGEDMMHQPEL